jgi:hypothetical protein
VPVQPLPALPETSESPVVAVVDGADGALGAELLVALRLALPKITLWPVGLNAVAYTAMSAALGSDRLAALPPDALSRVSVIVGPNDIVTPGGLAGEVPEELAAAISASPARKVLLPARAAQLPSLAIADRSRERWAAYAVAAVQSALSRK